MTTENDGSTQEASSLHSLVGLRQYYYRVNDCTAQSAQAADCICWHDEVTGPLADTRYGEPKEWREKPNEDLSSDSEASAPRNG